MTITFLRGPHAGRTIPSQSGAPYISLRDEDGGNSTYYRSPLEGYYVWRGAEYEIVSVRLTLSLTSSSEAPGQMEAEFRQQFPTVTPQHMSRTINEFHSTITYELSGFKWNN